MKRILILGGGFGGLVVAEKLSKKFAGKHEITLVSPHRTFTFYPGLVRLAFGELQEKDVTFDLAKKLRSLNVRFIEGEVLHMKPELKRVQIAGKDVNGNVSYDYLVIAIGRRLATEKIPGLFEYAHHLLGIRAAKKFGEAVKAFDQGNIVVALGPEARLPVPVCETAFALSRVVKDSPTKPSKITVVFPEDVKDVFGGAAIYGKLKEAFDNHGIELIENMQISEVTAKEVIAYDGRALPYDLVMLVPSFRGRARFSENGITDEENFVQVDEYLRVKGLDGIYAVGDIASFLGPKLAHIAVGQARVAAENLAMELNGEEPDKVYFHEIASIIDEGGGDSIYLHFGVWDQSLYRLKTGTVWSLIKRVHDKLWTARHEKTWIDLGA